MYIPSNNGLSKTVKNLYSDGYNENINTNYTIQSLIFLPLTSYTLHPHQYTISQPPSG